MTNRLRCLGCLFAALAISAALHLALQLLESAPAPRTTVQSPQRWRASADWKLDYCNIERLDADDIARPAAEFAPGKAQAVPLRRA